MVKTRLITAQLCIGLALGLVHSRSQQDEFDWKSISPSEKLEYHNCYGSYRCARLVLPLDWQNETDDATITIAITKLPATVNDTDPSFGGTIFTQPGGPGMSGTEYIRSRGQQIREAVEFTGKKRYELLAFDPRGIGHSTPRINCFPGILGVMRTVEVISSGTLSLSQSNLQYAIAGAKADYAQCEEQHGRFLSYVGTPNVARDMLAIVDKIEEWRRSEKRETHSSVQNHLDLRSPAEDLPRLQYFGISYGTALGNYFASMFPGRVARMVLDGVDDVNDYARGLGWLRNTQDTDEMADRFFQGCYEAGSQLCALRHDGDKSAAEIADRVWSWASTLDESPIFHVTETGYRIAIRSADIRVLLLLVFYDAVFLSQPFALQLNTAINGNNTLLAKAMLEFNQLESLPDGKEICSDPEQSPRITLDAQDSISCIDSDDVSTLNTTDWQNFLREQMAISKIAGACWARNRLACAGWKARPNWAFKGPFKTPEPSKSPEHPEPGVPAAPLLLISNRWDPVTPLRNARAIQKEHPRSGLMVLESSGHCVIRNVVSPCAKKVLAEYFAEGIVPAGEISCEAARSPWESDDDDDDVMAKTGLVQDAGPRLY